jgi:hemerythrin-like domain-containing protein
LFLRTEDPLKSTAPTDQLKAEHEKILILLGILERICARLEAKQNINPLFLEEVIQFIKIFIDKFHHGKEEDLLFPAMRKAGVRRQPGPIGELMIDHIKGRSLARDMNLAAERYRKYDRRASARFVESAKSYISLLSEHIRKEDEIYFPMAEKALTEMQKKELLESFGGFERTETGRKEHGSMLQILRNLEHTFLH